MALPIFYPATHHALLILFADPVALQRAGVASMAGERFMAMSAGSWQTVTGMNPHYTKAHNNLEHALAIKKMQDEFRKQFSP